ncbi:hypothetical protein GIB67_038671 [Kingdonia uniflora]|uniref:Pectinesterase inhibitor domain-containing protein n=1 Tax=Kingdonia uniflora TaxID=39325 RepID=A0A7J7NT89_9MAGN|nr:hypothetical protein GIB67_038671 [Kingdonia uniflora]
MMRSTLSLLISLSFSLLLLHGTTATPTPSPSPILRPKTDLIKETCKTSAKADSNIAYKFCVTSLQVVPKSHTTNLQGLGLITTMLIKNNLTHTHSRIRNLLKKPKFSKDMRSCLKVCLECYDEAIYTIKEVNSAIMGKRYNDANNGATTVMTLATTCEDVFSEVEMKSLFTKNNDDVFQLVEMDFQIINMLR